MKNTIKQSQLKRAFIGYARVSTDIQDTENQRHAIEAFCINNGVCKKLDRLETETISSGKKERRIFSIVDSLQENDVLIVYENSRLARNTSELLRILENIKTKKASLYIISNGQAPVIDKGKLDMNTEALLTMQGLFAKLEKEMIRSRVRNSLRQKKEHGTNTGNPLGKPKTYEVNLKQIAGLRGAGLSWKVIKDKTGVSRSLYYYHKNATKINTKKALERENA